MRQTTDEGFFKLKRQEKVFDKTFVSDFGITLSIILFK